MTKPEEPLTPIYPGSHLGINPMELLTRQEWEDIYRSCVDNTLSTAHNYLLNLRDDAKERGHESDYLMSALFSLGATMRTLRLAYPRNPKAPDSP